VRYYTPRLRDLFNRPVEYDKVRSQVVSGQKVETQDIVGVLVADPFEVPFVLFGQKGCVVVSRPDGLLLKIEDSLEREQLRGDLSGRNAPVTLHADEYLRMPIYVVGERCGAASLATPYEEGSRSPRKTRVCPADQFFAFIDHITILMNLVGF
jgi:hypothetical protein